MSQSSMSQGESPSQSSSQQSHPSEAAEAVSSEEVSSEAVSNETVSNETVASESQVSQSPAEETKASAEAAPTTDSPSEPGFDSLGLSDEIVAAVQSAGYKTPTPIQAETIPLVLSGRDVLGQAQTGTGKTAAFALPLLDRIDLSNRRPQVLVLAPTRELAIQVAKSFEKYAQSKRGLNVVPVYGGQDIGAQLREIKRGVHIVVGTPGRVMDHIRRGSLKFDALKCLVLDEADEMLRMGFAEDVEWVLTQTPRERQIALFSATMPQPIRQIAQKHLTDPAEITIAQRTATADTVNQRFLIASPHQKQAALARILEAEPTDGVLVFVKMRSTTEPVAESLAKAGFKTAALSGDVAQKQRERIVANLKSGKIDVIVATDVAARGLDVQRVSHVINYDLPHDSEAYVHRIGRTGRAGRSGEAILFVHPRERGLLKRLERATRTTIEQMEVPSNRVVNKQRVARFHDKITQALESKELETFQAIVDHYQRENDVPMETIAASLALLANRESPLIVQEEIKQVGFAPDSRDNRSRSQKKAVRMEAGNRSGPAGSQRSGAPMGGRGKATYRIEVGRSHNAHAGSIVGAIANEVGVGSNLIGKISVFDRHSTVELPQDLPAALIDNLKNVAVSGRKLHISRDESRPAASGYQAAKRRKGDVLDMKRPAKKSKAKGRKKAK